MIAEYAYLEVAAAEAGSCMDLFPTPTPTPTPTATPSTKITTAATAMKNMRLLSPQIVSFLFGLLLGSGGGIVRAVSNAMVELLPGLRGRGLPT